MYMVQQVNKLGKSDWYMAWYQDDEVLMNSSSGGAFTAIAEVVLQDNGVVFGATFDEKTWDVYHKPVTCIEELNGVADFAGRSAGQILFDPESLPGYPAPGP